MAPLLTLFVISVGVLGLCLVALGMKRIDDWFSRRRDIDARLNDPRWWL